MGTMNLVKRGLGSIIDKVIIIVAFVLVSFLLFGMYGMPGMLGTYVACMGFTPDEYSHLEQYSPYSLDFQVTALFVVLNIIYFFVSECFLKATVGKYMLGGIMVDANEKNIDTAKIAKRCSMLTLMMLIAIMIRWMFNTTYWTVIIIFFLVNDLPVLLMNSRQSMVDFLSSTFLVTKDNNKIQSNS